MQMDLSPAGMTSATTCYWDATGLDEPERPSCTVPVPNLTAHTRTSVSPDGAVLAAAVPGGVLLLCLETFQQLSTLAVDADVQLLQWGCIHGGQAGQQLGLAAALETCVLAWTLSWPLNKQDPLQPQAPVKLHAMRPPAQEHVAQLSWCPKGHSSTNAGASGRQLLAACFVSLQHGDGDSREGSGSSQANSRLVVWDAATGEQLHGNDRCYGCCWSSDGRLLAVLSQPQYSGDRGEASNLHSSCTVLEAGSWREVSSEGLEGGRPWRLAPHAHGVALAQVATHGGGVEVSVWRTPACRAGASAGLERRTATLVAGGSQQCTSLRWSPDGQRLAAEDGRGAVAVWDMGNLSTAPLLLHHDQEGASITPSELRWSPNSALLAVLYSRPDGGSSAMEHLLVWDATTGSVRRAFELSCSHSPSDRRPRGLLWAAGRHGSALLVADAGQLHCFNVTERAELLLVPAVGGQHHRPPRWSWSPDGSHLAVGPEPPATYGAPVQSKQLQSTGREKGAALHVWTFRHGSGVSCSQLLQEGAAPGPGRLSTDGQSGAALHSASAAQAVVATWSWAADSSMFCAFLTTSPATTSASASDPVALCCYTHGTAASTPWAVITLPAVRTPDTQVLRMFPHPVSPDGAWLAAQDDALGLQLLHTAAGQTAPPSQRLLLHSRDLVLEDESLRMLWSPGSSMLAAGRGSSVLLFALPTVVRAVDVDGSPPHAVLCYAWPQAATGRSVSTAQERKKPAGRRSSTDTSVAFAPLLCSLPVGPAGSRAQLARMLWSSCGGLLALVAEDGSLAVWRMPVVSQERLQDQGLAPLSGSPGAAAATTGTMAAEGHRQPAVCWRPPRPQTVSPQLALAVGGRLWVVEMPEHLQQRNGHSLHGVVFDVELAGEVVALTWSCCGSFLAAAMANGSVSVCDAVSGRVVRHLPASQLLGPGQVVEVPVVAWRPGGSGLAIATRRVVWVLPHPLASLPLLPLSSVTELARTCNSGAEFEQLWGSWLMPRIIDPEPADMQVLRDIVGHRNPLALRQMFDVLAVLVRRRGSALLPPGPFIGLPGCAGSTTRREKQRQHAKTPADSHQVNSGQDGDAVRPLLHLCASHLWMEGSLMVLRRTLGQAPAEAGGGGPTAEAARAPLVRLMHGPEAAALAAVSGLLQLEVMAEPAAAALLKAAYSGFVAPLLRTGVVPLGQPVQASSAVLEHAREGRLFAGCDLAGVAGATQLWRQATADMRQQQGVFAVLPDSWLARAVLLQLPATLVLKFLSGRAARGDKAPSPASPPASPSQAMPGTVDVQCLQLTPRNAAAAAPAGLLYLMQRCACPAAHYRPPLVQHLLAYKWQAVGAPLVLAEVAVHAVHLAVLLLYLSSLGSPAWQLLPLEAALCGLSARRVLLRRRLNILRGGSLMRNLWQSLRLAPGAGQLQAAWPWLDLLSVVTLLAAVALRALLGARGLAELCGWAALALLLPRLLQYAAAWHPSTLRLLCALYEVRTPLWLAASACCALSMMARGADCAGSDQHARPCTVAELVLRSWQQLLPLGPGVASPAPFPTSLVLLAMAAVVLLAVLVKSVVQGAVKAYAGLGKLQDAGMSQARALLISEVELSLLGEGWAAQQQLYPPELFVFERALPEASSRSEVASSQGRGEVVGEALLRVRQSLDLARYSMDESHGRMRQEVHEMLQTVAQELQQRQELFVRDLQASMATALQEIRTTSTGFPSPAPQHTQHSGEHSGWFDISTTARSGSRSAETALSTAAGAHQDGPPAAARQPGQLVQEADSSSMAAPAATKLQEGVNGHAAASYASSWELGIGGDARHRAVHRLDPQQELQLRRLFSPPDDQAPGHQGAAQQQAPAAQKTFGNMHIHPHLRQAQQTAGHAAVDEGVQPSEPMPQLSMSRGLLGMSNGNGDQRGWDGTPAMAGAAQHTAQAVQRNGRRSVDIPGAAGPGWAPPLPERRVSLDAWRAQAAPGWPNKPVKLLAQQSTPTMSHTSAPKPASNTHSLHATGYMSADPAAANGAEPAAHGTTPSAHGAMPAANGATPAAYGATPAAYGATPAFSGATPALNGATPAFDGATPAANGAMPAARFASAANFFDDDSGFFQGTKLDSPAARQRLIAGGAQQHPTTHPTGARQAAHSVQEAARGRAVHQGQAHTVPGDNQRALHGQPGHAELQSLLLHAQGQLYASTQHAQHAQHGSRAVADRQQQDPSPVPQDPTATPYPHHGSHAAAAHNMLATHTSLPSDRHMAPPPVMNGAVHHSADWDHSTASMPPGSSAHNVQLHPSSQDPVGRGSSSSTNSRGPVQAHADSSSLDEAAAAWAVTPGGHVSAAHSSQESFSWWDGPPFTDDSATQLSERTKMQQPGKARGQPPLPQGGPGVDPRYVQQLAAHLSLQPQGRMSQHPGVYPGQQTAAGPGQWLPDPHAVLDARHPYAAMLAQQQYNLSNLQAGGYVQQTMANPPDQPAWNHREGRALQPPFPTGQLSLYDSRQLLTQEAANPHTQASPDMGAHPYMQPAMAAGAVVSQQLHYPVAAMHGDGGSPSGAVVVANSPVSHLQRSPAAQPAMPGQTQLAVDHTNGAHTHAGTPSSEAAAAAQPSPPTDNGVQGAAAGNRWPAAMKMPAGNSWGSDTNSSSSVSMAASPFWQGSARYVLQPPALPAPQAASTSQLLNGHPQLPPVTTPQPPTHALPGAPPTHAHANGRGGDAPGIIPASDQHDESTAAQQWTRNTELAVLPPLEAALHGAGSSTPPAVQPELIGSGLWSPSGSPGAGSPAELSPQVLSPARSRAQSAKRARLPSMELQLPRAESLSRHSPGTMVAASHARNPRKASPLGLRSYQAQASAAAFAAAEAAQLRDEAGGTSFGGWLPQVDASTGSTARRRSSGSTAQRRSSANHTVLSSQRHAASMATMPAEDEDGWQCIKAAEPVAEAPAAAPVLVGPDSEEDEVLPPLRSERMSQEGRRSQDWRRASLGADPPPSQERLQNALSREAHGYDPRSSLEVDTNVSGWRRRVPTTTHSSASTATPDRRRSLDMRGGFAGWARAADPRGPGTPERRGSLDIRSGFNRLGRALIGGRAHHSSSDNIVAAAGSRAESAAARDWPAAAAARQPRKSLDARLSARIQRALTPDRRRSLNGSAAANSRRSFEVWNIFGGQRQRIRGGVGTAD